MTSSAMLRRSRGSAIPETAFIVSVFLMLLYATVEYAVLGYEQVSADGATFVGAHDTVAQFAGPSASNNTYTQKAISAVFSGLRTATVSSIANNGSYETDISMGNPTNGGLTGLLPTSLQTTSRTIEASQSTASGSPLGNCTTAATNLTTGLGTAVTSGPINLLQGTISSSSSALLPITQTAGGAVVDLNAGQITAHLSALSTIATQVTATAQILQTISSLLNTASLGGLLNGVVGPAGNLLSTTIQPLLTQALNGTLTQASITAATTTLQGSSALLTQVFGTALSPLLYGTGTTAGLLSGPGGSGLLMQLDAAETALQGLDKLAPASCAS